MAELRFFNPYGEIRHTANRLPHWQQEGPVYFVTFRLADAVPDHLRARWESEREAWLRTRNRGAPRSSANIMNAFQAQSNGGSTPATARAFCGDMTALRL